MLDILVIDDDVRISDRISEVLTDSGYRCTKAYDGQEGKELFDSQRWDLVLLDVMLPKISGYELLDYMKPTKTAVIVMSALNQVSDRINGLKLGADDYLCKPFQIGELVARVEAVIRRTTIMDDVFEHDGVKVNFNSRRVTLKGEEISLTVKEFELLRLFVHNQNVALDRSFLYENVWNDEVSKDTRTLDNHVRSLRKKLGYENVIHTVFRIGYRMDVS